MPRDARILRFPSRGRFESLSSAEVRLLVEKYLATPLESRSPDLTRQVILKAESLVGLFSAFVSLIETDPETVLSETALLYGALTNDTASVGLFDEKDYFIGEAARFGGWACRLLGKYSEAEKWLDRAEAAFRHTVNPGPLLAAVAYARMAVRYETGANDDVLEILPSLIKSFEKLGMKTEHAKSRFLLAVTLKAAGDADRGFQVLSDLQQDLTATEEKGLLGQVLTHMGHYHGQRQSLDEAVSFYKSALPVLKAGGRPIALAELKWSIGETYRAQDNLGASLAAYREAKSDYANLGMGAFAVKISLAIADTLLSLGRAREAEWEILAALPTIEEQKMVPEGFAAVALLKESVRRRKTDPNALRELREHLQASK